MSGVGRVVAILGSALLGVLIGCGITMTLAGSGPYPVEPIELNPAPAEPTGPTSSTTPAPTDSIVVPPPTLPPVPAPAPAQPPPPAGDDDNADDDDGDDDGED